MIAKDLHTGARLSSTGWSHPFLSSTSCLPMHLNIPRNTISPAFNVSSTTSNPVSESQNRYATLAVEECKDTNNDMTLKGSTNGSPARAEAKVVNPAGHGAESPIDASDIKANCLASSS
ncbi:hypothetical protein ARMSODRAFT_1012862 [Armillaria solidipes]|uniref:Uncharacterized protein n=1 Tax=Armillaria solidipes TaxID=1076256 RepID=A0A2H3CJB4_9AGAR|nr:hypothetical protein ARMSODRAFT_1012862 [Armillaria solidipes]